MTVAVFPPHPLPHTPTVLNISHQPPPPPIQLPEDEEETVTVFKSGHYNRLHKDS